MQNPRARDFSLSRLSGGPGPGQLGSNSSSLVASHNTSSNSINNWSDSLPRRDFYNLGPGSTASLPRRDKAGLGNRDNSGPGPGMANNVVPSGYGTLLLNGRGNKLGPAGARGIMMGNQGQGDSNLPGHIQDKRNSTGNLYFSDSFEEKSNNDALKALTSSLKSNGRVGSQPSISSSSQHSDEINDHMGVSSELKEAAGDLGKELKNLITMMDYEEAEEQRQLKAKANLPPKKSLFKKKE